MLSTMKPTKWGKSLQESINSENNKSDTENTVFFWAVIVDTKNKNNLH